MSAAKPRYEVLWTETARTDVEEIARFIAPDSVENALAVLDRLEHAAENLAVLPERGRLVPGVGGWWVFSSTSPAAPVIPHPHLEAALKNYASILKHLARSEAQIDAEMRALQGQYGEWARPF